jgi:hypothetical protein
MSKYSYDEKIEAVLRDTEESMSNSAIAQVLGTDRRQV